ncbi:multidrug ABC transporter ATP-binding protein [Bacillus sp. SA1-12]|uniref:ABC transporter ATP-binding protein n=1 Tax=Bacillus sp. SA1-12 TaxID=1455638 RepID=UPI000626D4B4|nr:ABC transporter ATP-binding protein [Bacillus sp. SA1-12]KKI94071.1 multidrug ABC transporter ATP-binding protein [Bacillus sp. SA1-12]
MKSVKKLLSFTKPYKLFVLFAPLLMALEVTMDLLQPMIMQKIIDNGIANEDMNYVISMGILMIGAAVIGLVGGAGCTIYSTRAAVNFASDIRRDVFKKATFLSNENRDQIGAGKLITILTSDISVVQTALMMTLRVFVRGPLLFIGSIIIVFFQARELFPLLLILVPILLFFIIFLSKKAGIWFKRVQEGMDHLNTKLQENIAGIRVVKAFVRKDYEISQFKRVNDSLTKTTIQADQIITVLMPILLLIINIGIVIALVLGVMPFYGGGLQVGVILAFINYLNIILMALMSSSMVLMQLVRAVPSADRIQQVLDTENKLENNTAFNNDYLINGSIEFKNVSFSYSKNGEKVLRNISFVAHDGQKIGIIGPTGSGKSTFMKLLPRLYDPDEGEILIDGKNIKTMNLENLRASIGYISQKPFLFSGSIKSNLKFGKTSATFEDLTAASKDACAAEFIEKLDGDFDHQLTQSATNLSGGQKQRLSIARAFIRKPAILILDDATSAVDARSEASILEALEIGYHQTTTFIIASKLSSVIQADKIIVLDEGEIVGLGTHQELLSNCTVYQEIYHTQVQKGGVVS